MRIAMTHVDLPNQSKGGVAYQVHYLANALVNRGHEVTMFTCSPAYADCQYFVHQYPVLPQLRKLQSFIFAGHLARTKFSKFDVLHVNGDNYLLPRRSPQIRTFYGSAKDEAGSAVRLRRRLYQTVIARLETVGAHCADINVGISEATRDRVPEVTNIIPCGVDISRFRPGAKADQPAILFVGTTGGRKRGTFLAEIFQREIRPRFPDAQLWTVAEKPIEGEGIINYGRLPVEELISLFQKAWVFCLPSTYEGFGVPYIEAMAAGTAVVASPNPGACEVLGQGSYGILAEDTAIGASINRLLAEGDERQRWVEIGLKRSSDYAWESVAAQYERLYTSLVTKFSVTNSVPLTTRTVNPEH